MPVTRLDGALVGTGSRGPITRALMDAYWKKHSDPDWSEAVPFPTVDHKMQPLEDPL